MFVRKEEKSTRYALVCFYISFAYSRARAKSFTRTSFGKNFVFVLERGEGKRKTDKQHPNRFFLSSRKDLKFSPIREGEKRKRIAGARRWQFASLNDSYFYPCSRLVVVQIQTHHQTNTRRMLDFSSISLSVVKSAKRNRFFLPDLGIF